MIVNTLWGPEETEFFKCIYCEKQKPISERVSQGTSGSKTRCKPCVSHHAKVVNKLKKENLSSKPIISDSCIICKRTGNELINTGAFNGNRGPWILDHDHQTEKFRGWICQHCNYVLGGFRDNIKSLENAIKYLKQNR